MDETTTPVSVGQTLGRFAAHETFREWLNGQDAGGSVPRLSQDEEENFRATCYAILMLEGLGELERVDLPQRARWGDYLKSLQRADDGLFVAPSAAGVGHHAAEAGHSTLSTYFALQALDALGCEPPHPLRFLDDLAAPGALRAWLEGLDWSAARAQSDRVMSVLFCLIHAAERSGCTWAPSGLHSALDWLDATQDPKSGLWGLPAGNSVADAIAVTYRLLPFFEYVRRPVQRVGRLIDTVLGMSPPDGSLVGAIGGGAAGDLAVVGVLAPPTLRVTYRREDTRRILLETYRVLRALEAQPEAPSESGNAIWHTWLRALTTATIEHLFPQDLPSREQWRFRRWPALGYLPSTGTCTDLDRSVLSRWKRPLSRSRLPAAPERHHTPSISVIIPCYNLGRYLHEALESVVNQTLQRFEVVLVNDGSTDPFTNVLLESLDLPGARVIQQMNQGLAAARNNGIAQARGRYICCLDPDDRLAPSFFATAGSILDSQPDVGLVSGHFRLFDEREDVYRYERCDFPELLAYNQVIEPALFRRDAWQRVGGYWGGFSSTGIEDWDLWISFLEHGYRAVVLPEVVWEYRIRPDQLSTTMYQPATWATLTRELVERHPDSYRRHMAEVMAIQSARWAAIRQWTNDREQAMVWWERQALSSQRLAEDRERLLGERQAWMKELEKAKDWWQHQAEYWRRTAEDLRPTPQTGE